MSAIEESRVTVSIPGVCVRGHEGEKVRRPGGKSYCRRCEIERKRLLRKDAAVIAAEAEAQRAYRARLRAEARAAEAGVDDGRRWSLAEWVREFPQASAARLWVERGGLG